ncbi:hypothetical protein AAHE18_13G163700 [Arachis hypogaea]
MDSITGSVMSLPFPLHFSDLPIPPNRQCLTRANHPTRNRGRRTSPPRFSNARSCRTDWSSMKPSTMIIPSWPCTHRQWKNSNFSAAILFSSRERNGRTLFALHLLMTIARSPKSG